MKKRALVTGSSRGIGAATARALAADGWEVNINYFQSEQQALALGAELGARVFQCDVSDPVQVEKMFNEMGPVELLVNNAGIAHEGLITDISNEEWQRIFAVNVGGVFNCIRAALPHMIHEKHGIIINTSSVLMKAGGSCEASYTATKGAIEGLTKSLARELAGRNICCNAIAPGFVKTDMTEKILENNELMGMIPLKRMGEPEEVASLAAFLADSDYITGEVIRIDGGLAM